MRSIPLRTMRNVWNEQNRSKTGTNPSNGLRNVGWTTDKCPWGISEVYEKPSQKPRIEAIQFEPGVQCILLDRIEDYNGNNNLKVILQFSGLDFLEGAFTKSRNDYGQNTCVYYARVSCRNREAFLILSTIGDILEFEVVPQKKGINQLFYDEVHIPELIEIYDPLSMKVEYRNLIAVVKYKKINTLNMEMM